MTNPTCLKNTQPTPQAMYLKLCELNEALQFIRMDMEKLQQIGAPLVVDFNQIVEALNIVKAMQLGWLQTNKTYQVNNQEDTP